MPALIRGRHLAPKRAMRGQAMAETVVVSLFFLVPFFLMIVIIGKFIDMRSATLQAARYMAFERTVYSASGNERDATMAKLTDTQLANGAKMRFFSGNFTAITQAQNDGTATFANNPLWVDQGLNPLVSNPADVSATATGNGEPAAFVTDDAIEVTLQPLHDLLGAGYALTLDKYYTAAVGVTPKLPIGPVGYLADLDSQPLTFSASDTLLADGWSASDEKYERCQAATMLPTAILGDADSDCPTEPTGIGVIGDVATALTTVLGLVIPDLGAESNGPPNFGYVDVTDAGTVPADRLKNYNPPPSSSGSSVTQAEIDQIVSQYKAQGYTLTKQVTNADGSVTLTFTNKYGGTTSVTLGGGGSGASSSSNQSMPGSPYTVWQKLAGTVYTSQNHYTVTSVKYLCAAPSPGTGTVTCNVDSGSPPPPPPYQTSAVEVDATVTLNVPNGTPTTQTITITPDPSTSGNSIVATN